MKKNVLCMAVLLIMVFNVQAQEAFRVGVHGGMNLSNYRVGGKTEAMSSRMKAGFTAGGFIQVDLSEYFSLQPGLDLQYQSSKLKSKTTDLTLGNVNNLALYLPVYAVIKADIGTGKGFLGAGPYLGYGLSAKSDGHNLYKKDNPVVGDKMRRLDYGIGCMAGYEFNRHWMVAASFKYGFLDLYKSPDISLDNQSVTLTLGYIF